MCMCMCVCMCMCACMACMEYAAERLGQRARHVVQLLLARDVLGQGEDPLLLLSEVVLLAQGARLAQVAAAPEQKDHLQLRAVDEHGAAPRALHAGHAVDEELDAPRDGEGVGVLNAA